MNFQQLAAASDFFILLAMVVYMMAFVAFAIDLAKAVRVRSDVRLAKKTRERELATVGAPARPDFAGSAPAADLDLSEGADDAEAELAPARGMNPLTFALGAAGSRPLSSSSVSLRAVSRLSVCRGATCTSSR